MAGRGVLRGRDLPEDDGGRRFDPRGGERGDEVTALPGEGRLPLESLRGRGPRSSYAVRAARFVPAGKHVPGVGRPAVRGRRLGVVPLVPAGAAGMFFGNYRVVSFSVPAVSCADVGHRGRRLAPQVGASRGGEHATPAARHQGEDDTEIYELSSHCFTLTV